MAPLILHIQALFFRTLQRIFTTLDLSFSHPIPNRPTFTRTIPSTHSQTPGSIDLLFYTPSSYTLPPPPSHIFPPSPSLPSSQQPLTQSPATPLSPPPKHPLLINLHGGGFSIGHARDDARFLTHITSSLSCVAVSIDYRLAPTYPFPTAIEDIISSILYLWEHAEEFGIDTEETVITGFSAGGFLAYSVVIGLEDMLKKRKEEGKDRVKGRVKGLVVFYGGCDYTSTRAEKDASNPNLIPVIPPSLYRFFDRSYLQGNPDKTSPLLTPGLAPREALRRAMPETIVMINCGGDQLLAESLRFGERLRSLGKRVEGMVIEGEGHAWDKKPSFKKGNVKRDEAYDFAVKNLKHIWGFKK